MRSPTVEELRAALARAGQLVAGIEADQWAATTPCEGWDLRALVSHLVSGNRQFAAALRGDEPTQLEADADLLSAFEDSGRELLSAFSTPGVLQRVVRVPFGDVPGEVALHLRLTELLVHGWDIAWSTGQRPEFEESVAEQELEFSRGALGAIPPDRRPFGQPQQAPENASSVDKLAALLGREVISIA